MADMDPLSRLYDEARAEGGQLVVYAGGDAPEQADMYTAGFTDRFPDIRIEVSVDLSKYHDGRIDAAHLRGDNRVDVVHLQTLHDFPYWKKQGMLLPFKPEGFEQLPEAFKDPDGTYYPLFVFAFSNVVDTKVIPADKAPREAADYLRPDLKGRIVLVYPHDDASSSRSSPSMASTGSSASRTRTCNGCAAARPRCSSSQRVRRPPPSRPSTT